MYVECNDMLFNRAKLYDQKAIQNEDKIHQHNIYTTTYLYAIKCFYDYILYTMYLCYDRAGRPGKMTKS